jgi:hypothetical protein
MNGTIVGQLKTQWAILLIGSMKAHQMIVGQNGMIGEVNND